MAILAVAVGTAGIAASGGDPPTAPHDHGATDDDHDHGAGTPAATDAAGHDHGAPATEPTAEEQTAADQLVAATRAAAVRFDDFAAADAEGYVRTTPLGRGGRGPAHYVKPAYVVDGLLLDPERPEALVYLHTGAGEPHLLGVMFLAPPGEGPTPGGPLTRWHGHPGMCSGQSGIGTQEANGACPPGQRPVRSEMMHVWTFDHPDGPLAHHLGRNGLLAAIEQFGR